MRKEKVITISDKDSRDDGKKFHIIEMPAAQAEKWALRALLVITRSGVDIPEDAASGGMRALAVLGLRSLMGLSFEDAEPLLDEMMGCVQIVEKDITRDLTESDIEEVRTRVRLRKEVLELHLGFSLADGLSQ